MIGTALGILNALLAIFSKALGLQSNQQLIDAGKAEANAATQTKTLEQVQHAQTLRDNVRADLARNPSRLHDDDGFRRAD